MSCSIADRSTDLPNLFSKVYQLSRLFYRTNHVNNLYFDHTRHFYIVSSKIVFATLKDIGVVKADFAVYSSLRMNFARDIRLIVFLHETIYMACQRDDREMIYIYIESIAELYIIAEIYIGYDHTVQ